MKRVTRQEFISRTAEVAKARKIFTPHLTRDISIAFDLYQEVLADEQRQVFLTEINKLRRAPNMLDAYVRPKCPECGADMRLRVLPPQGKKNVYGFKTQWVCGGDIEKPPMGDESICVYEDPPSHKSVDDWMAELKADDANP